MPSPAHHTPGRPSADLPACETETSVQHSCLYEGVVFHGRFGQIDHRFDRKLYMFYLDLAELPGVLDGGRFWSSHRAALARFRRSDYLGDPAVPLDDAVRNLVEERTGERPCGPIRMLTQIRHLGIGFNPITVYYCFDRADTRVDTLVAEVRNTPWLERHCYVLPLGERPPHGRAYRLSHDKSFHVSPFMQMDYAYRWRIGEPDERLLLSIELMRGEQRAFQAALRLRRRPLDTSTLRGMLLRYPLMSAQAIAGIYVEAFKLWRKGSIFYSHPKYSDARPKSGDEAGSASDVVAVAGQPLAEAALHQGHARNSQQ